MVEQIIVKKAVTIMKKILALILCMVFVCCSFVGCGSAKKTIVIYTCAIDDRIAHMTADLEAKFPDLEFVIEYQSTSKLTAKLVAEGTNTDCDIIHDLSYLNLDSLVEKDLLADLSEYDTSIYVEGAASSKYYLPELRTGGAVIINTKVLADKGLAKPTSYEDLLKPEYKGLISMPDPKSSGTGYMFLKCLVNAWGEEKAYKYFEKLSDNILQFTSSGSGPVNALVQQEVAIGLGMITNAATQIGEGAPLEILVFEEGAPHSMYGQSIVKGKETDENIKEVFDYIISDYNYKSCEKFAPEKIYKDKDFKAPNFPETVKYADMSGDTLAAKEALLAKWGSWE